MGRPVREQDQIIIRVPDGMRDALHEAAKKNSRSLTGEVVDRLRSSLEGEGSAASGGPSIYLNITVVGQNDIAERVGAAARAAIQDALSSSCGVAL